MSSIITRTYFGARDLYHGIPDLKNSTVIDVIYEKDFEDYRTTLIFKDVKGIEHTITIAQAY
jgi:hypothetical protein